MLGKFGYRNIVSEQTQNLIGFSHYIPENCNWALGFGIFTFGLGFSLVRSVFGFSFYT
jgi:hypothetical protein